MSKNNVKPTEKQRSTFAHIKRGLKLKDAMIAGGFSPKSAENPKQNFMARAGTQEMMDEYRSLIIKNGVSLDMLSEIQIEGLFDQNGAVRLQYLKETKKDLGFTPEETPPTTNNFMIVVSPIDGNT